MQPRRAFVQEDFRIDDRDLIEMVEVVLMPRALPDFMPLSLVILPIRFCGIARVISLFITPGIFLISIPSGIVAGTRFAGAW